MIVSSWLFYGIIALALFATPLAVLGWRQAYLGWRRERCVVRCYYALSDWAEAALRTVLGRESEVEHENRAIYYYGDDPVADWSRMVKHHFSIMAYHGVSPRFTDVDEGYVVTAYANPDSWGNPRMYRLDRLHYS